MDDAFFVHDGGDRFIPTDWTIGRGAVSLSTPGPQQHFSVEPWSRL